MTVALLFSWDLSDGHTPRHNERAPNELADDAIVVARVRAGDTAIFEQLFRHYADRLAGFVFRYLRSREESEDVVQDIFLRIWRNHTEWRVRGTVNDYLYLAARNQVRDRIAHRVVVRRHEEQSIRAQALETSEQSSSSDDDAECHAELVRAIDELPTRRRDVCLLRWRDGLSYAEIARRLGVSEKTVENQLARAFKTLRERFGRPPSAN